MGANVGQNWFYAVANVTTQQVSFDIFTDVITTNDLGDYYTVLSNLNDSISGVARITTGMSRGRACRRRRPRGRWR